MKGSKACKQGVINILNIFIAYSIYAEIVTERLMNKLIEQFACFLESLYDRIGSKF